MPIDGGIADYIDIGVRGYSRCEREHTTVIDRKILDLVGQWAESFNLQPTSKRTQKLQSQLLKAALEGNGSKR